MMIGHSCQRPDVYREKYNDNAGSISWSLRAEPNGKSKKKEVLDLSSLCNTSGPLLPDKPSLM